MRPLVMSWAAVHDLGRFGHVLAEVLTMVCVIVCGFPRCVERERCECYSDYLHVTAKCTVVARAELGSMFELESDLGRYGHPSHVL